MPVDEPLQIDLAPPTVTAGAGFVDIFTLSVLLQPVDVIVSVRIYIVVTVGLTLGLLLVLVKPEGLLIQLYVCPLVEEPPMLVAVPLHTVDALPTVADGKGLTVMDDVKVSLDVLPSLVPFGELVHTFIE